MCAFVGLECNILGINAWNGKCKRFFLRWPPALIKRVGSLALRIQVGTFLILFKLKNMKD